VNEVVMQNEYALRLKEVAMNERVRELTDKFTVEMEADRAKFEQLLQDKNEAEMEAEETARRTEERHQVGPVPRFFNVVATVRWAVF
jgi:cilia- and flagella-associated protein 57